MKLKQEVAAVKHLGLFGNPEEKTKRPADYDMIDMGVHQTHPPKNLRIFVLKQSIEKAKAGEEEKPAVLSNGS